MDDEVKDYVEYCVIVDRDGNRRKMLAPKWWTAARMNDYPDGFLGVFVGPPPWVSTSRERRYVRRMLSLLT